MVKVEWIDIYEYADADADEVVFPARCWSYGEIDEANTDAAQITIIREKKGKEYSKQCFPRGVVTKMTDLLEGESMLS